MKNHSNWFNTALLLLAGFLATFPATAQITRGNGNVIEQKREVGSFDIIEVKKGIDLYLTQGSPAALMVKAEENLMEQVVAKVEGRTLQLSTMGSITTTKGIKIYLTLVSLRELHASGGSDVFAEDGLTLGELKLVCSGGSDTKMKLDVGALHCEMSGGSDAVLYGKAEKLMVETSGGSDFDGKKLEAVKCTIHSSGASDAWVYATGEIEIEASGASDVHYKGGAKVVRSKASRGADIHGN